MEVTDVYDAQKHRKEKTHPRGVPMEFGEYRFVVTVLIFNSQGQLLIQRRHPDKASWPGYWDYSASGAVIAGEALFEAAERETREELGISLSLQDIPSRLTVRFAEGWNEIYFVTKDIPLVEITLQASEVTEAAWVNEKEYLRLLETNAFIPYIYGKSIFDLYRSEQEHY